METANDFSLVIAGKQGWKDAGKNLLLAVHRNAQLSLPRCVINMNFNRDVIITVNNRIQMGANTAAMSGGSPGGLTHIRWRLGLAAIATASLIALPFLARGDVQSSKRGGAIAAGGGGGVQLRCSVQSLAGIATSQGLWLASTADAVENAPFRLAATGIGRAVAPPTHPNQQSDFSFQAKSRLVLPDRGSVSVLGSVVCWVRPGLTEEYSVNMDGVRQDFVIENRPVGVGALAVELSTTGASVTAASVGIVLTLEGSHRELAYTRLKVVDATGAELSAGISVTSPEHVLITVDDANAEYPVRIDPTFTDANWISRWAGYAGVNGFVSAIAVNTNAGLIYIGGQFTAAGSVSATNVAVWNGTDWKPLGLGTRNAVSALAVDNSGVLYAGGSFTNVGGTSANYVARWDGTNWTALGTGLNASVSTLAIDSSGRLFAGGSFTSAGIVPANHVASWDGANWSGLGSGCEGTVNWVSTDSAGNLYAGGLFTYAGNIQGNNIARWDGANWWPLGAGVGNVVYAVASDGAGNVYAGGFFTNAGSGPANYVAKWDGANWTALGSGANSSIQTLSVGPAGELYVGGNFTSIGGIAVNRVAKWDGTSWSALGSGLNAQLARVVADGSGHLLAGGSITLAGGLAVNGFAVWNGTNWSSYAPGPAGINNVAYAVAADTVGNVYMEGQFTTAGGSPVNGITKWNGTNWSALGSGLLGPIFNYTFNPLLAAGGSNLYAFGVFTNAGGVSVANLAKWDGSHWSAMPPVGSGGLGAINFPAGIRAMAADTRGMLYTGGAFTSVGSLFAQNVAGWNGSNWFALGSGCEGPVFAMVSDRAGNTYAGGRFIYAGNVQANNVAKWDGTNWSALGSGLAGVVEALAVDGSGNLYAGAAGNGQYPSPLTVSKWNGTNWTVAANAVDISTNFGNFAYLALVAGQQGDLYIGGIDLEGSGVLLRWDGTNWGPMGSGVNGFVRSLASDGNGHLFAGGTFTVTGTNVSFYFAEAVIGTATNPPTLSYTNIASGGLGLSWPFDHVGWRLQSQTNPSPITGIGTNWFTVPGSTNVNATNFPATVTNGSVFYRLVYP